MDTVLMDMVDGYSTNGCGGWTKHTDIIQTISNLLSIFMAYIFFVSFIRTSCTSPNAPRPIIWISVKSVDDKRFDVIVLIDGPSMIYKQIY